jgi:adenosylhomocysteine nucleosidase
VEDAEVEPVVDVTVKGKGSPPIVFFAALRQELAGLERGLVGREESAAGNKRLLRGYYQGCPVLLVQTGPGKQNAMEAARSVLAGYSPRAAVCIGFAGALKAELEGGDLVLCSSLHYLDGQGKLSEPLSCDEALIELAAEASQSAGLGLRVGSSVTVDEECVLPGIKEGLGRRVRADVVEMEYYWLAQVAAERGVPFVAVRAISDTLLQTLPEGCSFMDERGETTVAEVALHAVRHPRSLLPLLRLSVNGRRCTANLTAFAGALLDVLV